MPPELDNRTLALTLARFRDTIDQRPSTTIKPDPTDSDETGRQAMAALEQLGERTGTVHLGQTLGQGGMGVVRLAQQLALGRTVAVKTLADNIDGNAPKLALLREAWVTGSLEHPNVVPVHDVGLDDKRRPFILMKRIEGEEWGRLMHKAEVVEERFGAPDLLDWNLRILLQVANAIRFAHDRGVLHRDLKPENVMIGAFGEVYVLDWGIAINLVDDGSGRLPASASKLPVAGTPCYMAPEMLTGGPLDARTDIYLLGGLLYEILSGTAPHAGKDFDAIIETVGHSVPAPPLGAPAELVSLCHQTLHPDPEERPTTAEAFARAIQDFLSHRGAAQLAEEADERLEELRELVAAESPDALAITAAWSTCRFGYLQALQGWPECTDARQHLAEAARLVVRWHLAQGDAATAATVTRELADLPAELREEVEAALAARASSDRELAELQRQLDPRIGQRTRWFVAVSTGALWTVTPLSGYVFARWEATAHTHPVNVIWPLFFLAVLLGVGIWARESLSATALNRSFLLSLCLAPVSMVAMALGGWQMGLTPHEVQILEFVVFFAIAAMVVVTTEPRIWPTALAYLLAFVLLVFAPEHLYATMSAANGVLAINVGIMWFPGREHLRGPYPGDARSRRNK